MDNAIVVWLAAAFSINHHHQAAIILNLQIYPPSNGNISQFESDYEKVSVNLST
jgi:hypothetical protein